MRVSVTKPAVLAFVAAFAAVDGAHAQNADGWKANCYAMFWEHVNALSGSSARDCGFFDLQSAPEDKERVRTCARQAARGTGAFKFGHLTFWVDSAVCEVAVRDDGGNYWELRFDFDVNGGGGDHPSPALWVSKCDGLRFKRGRAADQFFEFQHCEERQDIERSLLDGTYR
jgi:hypothetical protein